MRFLLCLFQSFSPMCGSLGGGLTGHIIHGGGKLAALIKLELFARKMELRHWRVAGGANEIIDIPALFLHKLPGFVPVRLPLHSRFMTLIPYQDGKDLFQNRPCLLFAHLAPPETNWDKTPNELTRYNTKQVGLRQEPALVASNRELKVESMVQLQ